MGDEMVHAVARARVRDGARLYLATRYDDGVVSICQLALRDGFGGAGQAELVAA